MWSDWENSTKELRISIEMGSLSYTEFIRVVKPKTLDISPEKAQEMLIAAGPDTYLIRKSRTPDFECLSANRGGTIISVRFGSGDEDGPVWTPSEKPGDKVNLYENFGYFLLAVEEETGGTPLRRVPEIKRSQE